MGERQLKEVFLKNGNNGKILLKTPIFTLLIIQTIFMWKKTCKFIGKFYGLK
jgi:hypothetical protein